MNEIDFFRLAVGLQPRKRTQRRCLKCGRTFLSESPDNRKCKDCKKTEQSSAYKGVGFADICSVEQTIGRECV